MKRIHNLTKFLLVKRERHFSATARNINVCNNSDDMDLCVKSLRSDKSF